MTHIASRTCSEPAARFGAYTAALLAVLLIWRVVAIILSPLELGADEAQYWRWGQAFSWGYYSKPPLIAWLIGSVTAIFGDSAWAVRLPAPALHTLTASLLFLTARKMHDARTGFYAVLIYILMPGVTFSSGLMTTDSILFVFWALSLFILWTLRSGDASPLWALGLGLAIGAGFLAKYAMVYFLIGFAFALIIDKPTRKAFTRSHILLAIIGTSALLGLHIVWSLENDLQTLSHTADNANWSGALFNPENAVKFLVDQMGIFGPVSFLTLLASFGVAFRRRQQTTDQTIWRWLLCFILPPLVIILVQAITARAHANWAATAYLAASLLVAHLMTSKARLPKSVWLAAAGAVLIAALSIPDLAWMTRAGLGILLATILLGIGLGNRWRARGLLWTSLVVHSLAALAFTTLAAGPTWLADEVGFANAFKRTRGWAQTAKALSGIAEEYGATGIMVDERENWHGLDFYGRGTVEKPVYAWQRYPVAKSYADLHPLADRANGPILIASVRRRFRKRIRADFEQIEEIGYLSIPLGGGLERRFKIYLGYGHEPLERSADWETRFAEQVED